jgi:hypothetical protein
MLTLFSTPKPFSGHSNVIQRNALESWKRLHPDIEIILFGDDQGAAEICRELNLRHEASVERKEDGTKSLESIFGRAQQIARHRLVCYANCDIIFTSELIQALRIVSGAHDPFLMVGRRWDTDITEPIDFSQRDWAEAVTRKARSEGCQRLYYNIDYFAFPRGLYREFPDLVIGRNWWDQWLVWKAADEGAPVIDISEVLCAIHQNHDYSYHPQGIQGVWFSEGSFRNLQNAGGRRYLHTIEDANFRLTQRGLERNRFYWLAPAKRRFRENVATVWRYFRVEWWHPFLNLTRPIRAKLGIRKEHMPQPASRKKGRVHPLDQSWTPKIEWQNKSDDRR